jgi:hypothetical protein
VRRGAQESEGDEREPTTSAKVATGRQEKRSRCVELLFASDKKVRRVMMSLSGVGVSARGGCAGRRQARGRRIDRLRRSKKASLPQTGLACPSCNTACAASMQANIPLGLVRLNESGSHVHARTK